MSRLEESRTVDDEARERETLSSHLDSGAVGLVENKSLTPAQVQTRERCQLHLPEKGEREEQRRGGDAEGSRIETKTKPSPSSSNVGVNVSLESSPSDGVVGRVRDARGIVGFREDMVGEDLSEECSLSSDGERERSAVKARHSSL